MTTEWGSRDSPQVELMRFTDMQSIDRIASVRKSRTREQHIVVARRRDHLQRTRNHGRGLSAKEQLLSDVARVSRIARGSIGRIVEIVVIVRDRYQRWR